jgi:hypothetical protein
MRFFPSILSHRFLRNLAARTKATFAATDKVLLYNANDGMVAVPKTALLDAIGGLLPFRSQPFTFDTGTAQAGTGAGELRLNHATPASATGMHVHEVDYNGAESTTLLGLLAAGDRLILAKANGATPALLEVRVSDALTDNGTNRTVPFTVLQAVGTFVDGDKVVLMRSTLPAQPAAGTKVLTSTDGVLSWEDLPA